MSVNFLVYLLGPRQKPSGCNQQSSSVILTTVIRLENDDEQDEDDRTRKEDEDAEVHRSIIVLTRNSPLQFGNDFITLDTNDRGVMLPKCQITDYRCRGEALSSMNIMRFLWTPGKTTENRWKLEDMAEVPRKEATMKRMTMKTTTLLVGQDVVRTIEFLIHISTPTMRRRHEFFVLADIPLCQTLLDATFLDVTQTTHMRTGSIVHACSSF